MSSHAVLGGKTVTAALALFVSPAVLETRTQNVLFVVNGGVVNVALVPPMAGKLVSPLEP
jgi:hypothetical protein